jgi:acetyl esterase/lipase
MKIINNEVIYGTAGRDFSLDLYLPDTNIYTHAHPLLIFAHGFKGFKDWGHWKRIAQVFSSKGFAFLKFNFSHNGTNPQNPTAFCDLEAFGNNNFSKELSDLNDTINWACKNAKLYNFDIDHISLIGHSRGGPIAILQGAKDIRIAKIITWASVHELDYAWQDPEQLEKWKSEGMIYTKNARTGQEMPLYYQLYEDFWVHRDKFSVKKSLSILNKPFLVIHGSADSAVGLYSAEYLITEALNAKLKIIEDADHVFGGRHPFLDEEELPKHSLELINETCRFLIDK